MFPDGAKIEKAVFLRAHLLLDGVKIDESIESLFPYRYRTEHLYRHGGDINCTNQYPI